MALLKPAR